MHTLFGQLRGLFQQPGQSEAQLLTQVVGLFDATDQQITPDLLSYTLHSLGLPKEWSMMQLRLQLSAISLTTLSRELQDATDALYQAFAHHRRPSSTPSHSPLKDSDALQAAWRQMCATPLDAIAATPLQKFLTHTMTTWGAEDAFMHFVPRLLQTFVHSFLNRPLLFDKLTYAQWGTWPPLERDAVVTWLLLVWRLELEQQRGEMLLDFARLGRHATFSFQHMLHVWTPNATDHPAHLLGFAKAVVQLAHMPQNPYTASFFIWAKAPEHLQALEDAFLKWGLRKEDAEVVSQAVEFLELM